MFFILEKNIDYDITVKKDQEKLIQKFNIKADQCYLYVRFMDMTYLIDRNSGCIKKTVDNLTFIEECATLSVFDYLCLSKEERQLSGQWVNMQEMSNMIHANILEGKGDMFAKDAKLFEGHKEELEKACQYLKGRRMSTGDVSYVLDCLMSCRCIFSFGMVMRSFRCSSAFCGTPIRRSMFIMMPCLIL